jgi:thioredoxin-like negative regulator of GroEL
MKPAINSDQFEEFQRMMKLGIAHGCTEQAMAIMKFLRSGVTPSVEMVIFEAWLLIGAEQLQEARQILETAAQAEPGNNEVKAVLATALFFAEDELWRAYAYEVEQAPVPDPVASDLIARLKAAAETGHSVGFLHRVMLQPPPREPVLEAA